MDAKVAVAGYMNSSKKLQLKIMTLDDAVSLLKSYRHFDYKPEQIESLKKSIMSPKGHFVEFNEVKFRLLKVD